ncbi:MAG: rhomboid family intramembrane serine protease, partial [Dietzia cercidiphylli]
AMSGIRPLISVTLISWLASGVVSWVLGGTGTVHIGASGIVFGYIFYVIVRGLFSRRFLHLVVGLVIGFYYGFEALAGLSPMLDGVSWQGHLGGAIGGVLSAYGLKRDRTPQAVTAGQRRNAGSPR